MSQTTPDNLISGFYQPFCLMTMIEITEKSDLSDESLIYPLAPSRVRDVPESQPAPQPYEFRYAVCGRVMPSYGSWLV